MPAPNISNIQLPPDPYNSGAVESAVILHPYNTLVRALPFGVSDGVKVRVILRLAVVTYESRSDGQNYGFGGIPSGPVAGMGGLTVGFSSSSLASLAFTHSPILNNEEAGYGRFSSELGFQISSALYMGIVSNTPSDFVGHVPSLGGTTMCLYTLEAGEYPKSVDVPNLRTGFVLNSAGSPVTSTKGVLGPVLGFQGGDAAAGQPVILIIDLQFSQGVFGTGGSSPTYRFSGQAKYHITRLEFVAATNMGQLGGRTVRNRDVFDQVVREARRTGMSPLSALQPYLDIFSGSAASTDNIHTYYSNAGAGQFGVQAYRSYNNLSISWVPTGTMTGGKEYQLNLFDVAVMKLPNWK
jgi:hypothetical protein